MVITTGATAYRRADGIAVVRAAAARSVAIADREPTREEMPARPYTSNKSSAMVLRERDREASVSYMSTKNVIAQIHAAIVALGEEDLRSLPEATLTEQINQLVGLLDQLDAQLTRIANTVLARTFTVSEVVAT